jgi:hypothetical protein
MRSDNTMRISVAISEIPAANANLPQRIASRRRGSRPRIQRFRPSRDMRGKMNRLVNVERMSAVTARFKNESMLRQ